MNVLKALGVNIYFDINVRHNLLSFESQFCDATLKLHSSTESCLAIILHA